MYKEFLEIVGNGSPTGSVQEETIAVSVTISINVQKLHHQIRLRILSCSRMREMRREPEVPEEKVPAVERLDGVARINSKGICTNSFCEKWHPPECLLYKTKSGCRFGEKCSYAHRQVDEQPSKRSKKNDDKSAVAILKKNDMHESVWQPVVNCDKSHERPERPDVKRDTCHELRQGPVGRRSSNARQLGCVFQDMEPPKLSSILRKCGEGELVSGVHTLVGGVVQVYHRLQVLEEEEKGRKVEQEIEREDQDEENARMTMHMEMV